VFQNLRSVSFVLTILTFHIKETFFVYQGKRGFLLFQKVEYDIIISINRNFTRYGNMLERMGEFFDARLNGYEEHQLKTIASAEEFYPFTADCLPKVPGSRILDLGCGTGLELRYYFDIVPTAEITGIDLASGMLEALKEKFPGKNLTLIHGSYFDIPLEENAFDAVVSVESLHHFTKEEKIPLYEKVRKALKPGRYFILTDYFAASNEEEESRRTEFLRLRKEQGICDDAFYHFDTPLTVDHEKEALLIAGFSSVTILGAWGPTYTLKAER
jgi:tRNA (cmo5U34)-methyltransferase